MKELSPNRHLGSHILSLNCDSQKVSDTTRHIAHKNARQGSGARLVKDHLVLIYNLRRR